MSYEEYLETHSNKKPKGCLRIFGRAFLALTLGLIVFMIGFVLFRSYEQEPHGALARFTWTERSAAAAESDGTVTADSIEPQVNYTPDKYFLVYNAVHIPASDEWQMTVAYNLNRLGREAEESGTDGSVYLSEDRVPFIFILYDSDGNIYDSYDYLLQVKHFHGFCRLVFYGVPDEAEGLSLAVFRREDAENIGTDVIGNGDGALVPWQELVILNDSATVKPYEFDKAELYTGAPADGLLTEPDAVAATQVSHSTAPEQESSDSAEPDSAESDIAGADSTETDSAETEIQAPEQTAVEADGQQ